MSSESKKKILLHIGLHKTGTTSIQGILKQLSDELEQQGVSYLRTGFGRTTKEHLGHHNLSWEIINDPRFRSDMGDWEYVQNHIKKSEFNNFIISSEAFEYCFPEKEKMLLLASYLKDFHVDILLNLRNQIDLLQSVYLEISDQFMLEDPDTWIKKRVEKSRFQFYDMIQSWSSIFGRDHLIITAFEEEKKDLVAPLLGHFSIDKRKFSTQKKSRLNVSKNSHFIELNRKLCKIASQYIDESTYSLELAPIFNQVANDLGWFRKGEDIIQQDTADYISEYFREQNLKIAQEYRLLPASYFESRPVNLLSTTLSDDEILNFFLRACIKHRFKLHETRADLIAKLGQENRAVKIQKKAESLFLD